MEQMEETDDTNIQTQQSAFEANQSQKFTTMQQWLKQCMLANGNGTSLSPIINTNNKDTSQNPGQINDGLEGVQKTEKYYKNCNNAC